MNKIIESKSKTTLHFEKHKNNNSKKFKIARSISSSSGYDSSLTSTFPGSHDLSSYGATTVNYTLLITMVNFDGFSNLLNVKRL